jgi:hypothetical protein
MVVTAVADPTSPCSEYGLVTAQPEKVPVIEQAKGIVMARERCGPEQAFDLVRRASQKANLKVRVLAALLVEQVAGTAAAGSPGSEPSGAAGEVMAGLLGKGGSDARPRGHQSPADNSRMHVRGRRVAGSGGDRPGQAAAV